jgi:hypothetical protein
MVDKRTLEKYEKEAKEQGRESWYLSWALDLNAEERAKVCCQLCLAFIIIIRGKPSSAAEHRLRLRNVGLLSWMHQGTRVMFQI